MMHSHDGYDATHDHDPTGDDHDHGPVTHCGHLGDDPQVVRTVIANYRGLRNDYPTQPERVLCGPCGASDHWSAWEAELEETYREELEALAADKARRAEEDAQAKRELESIQARLAALEQAQP